MKLRKESLNSGIAHSYYYQSQGACGEELETLTDRERKGSKSIPTFFFSDEENKEEPDAMAQICNLIIQEMRQEDCCKASLG